MGGLQLFLVMLLMMTGTRKILIEAAPADGEKFTVRFLHTNDMHSRFEETSRESSICNDRASELGKCYGGFARIATLIREARQQGEINDLPTFFLNAGDTYQGSDLFTTYKWKIVARFLNILQPDVVSLGNHEFDNKVSGLVPFLQNIDFPVVAANLDLREEPELQRATKLTKSFILSAKGRKIGVVGYLTPDTVYLSQTGKVRFIDEVVAIRAEAEVLQKQGCDIIVALGHSGFETDKRIAREVELVDLVIGGHTNTFLFTGKAPDIENIEGLYPTEVKQSSGRIAYVVQAYAYTKYLGDLLVDFDSKGEIVGIRGSPKLVDSSVPMDENVKNELESWMQPLGYTKRVIGSTKVMLQGSEKICRLQECNMGNLLTDAMVYHVS
ncbi:hypothetical protein QAD02_023149 [Eretmocerus hayati]|uniref:Uncharacterized protein n=1 Tax=Eretmocerus hayati TaxID=131215 RepID=A0ACC2PUT6_9HYME|nr:hypothetical protein QAD02_023149 [Eretmocerus hayati]